MAVVESAKDKGSNDIGWHCSGGCGFEQGLDRLTDQKRHVAARCLTEHLDVAGIRIGENVMAKNIEAGHLRLDCIEQAKLEIAIAAKETTILPKLGRDWGTGPHRPTCAIPVAHDD